jgi:hypothetical protein
MSSVMNEHERREAGLERIGVRVNPARKGLGGEVDVAAGSGRRAERLVRRRLREVSPKRIPEIEEPTQRNGRLLTYLIDPRAYDYE